MEPVFPKIGASCTAYEWLFNTTGMPLKKGAPTPIKTRRFRPLPQTRERHCRQGEIADQFPVQKQLGIPSDLALTLQYANDSFHNR